MSISKNPSYIERVNRRRLIGGETDKLMAISPMKHKWAREFWQLMNANTWFPAEIKMNPDVMDYKFVLNEAERETYDMALAFVSNLDGFQFNNLMDNIGKYITSPEVKMVISRQTFEEANHVDAYALMIEAISLDPMEVYMTFERDGVLAAKNEYISRLSEQLGEDFSPTNFALAVIANIILEGVYFYSAFLVFYNFARHGKMKASAAQIRLINKDEVCHMHFFLAMLKCLQEENPEVFTDDFWTIARGMFIEAAGLEIEWGKHIARKGVLGYTPQIIEAYVQWLVNQRMAMVGLAPAFPGVQNPCEWVDDFASVNGAEENFFEDKVTNYAVGGGGLNW